MSNEELPISNGGEVSPSATIPFTTLEKSEQALTSPLRSGISATPSAGSAPQRPLAICVTGQMAAGKNYVCSQLEKQGFLSLDLDKVAHEAISLSTAEILAAFSDEAKKRGISLQNDDGSLNRRALGALVFSSQELLSKQEGIVYPKIIEMTERFIEENRGKSAILNATVLFKTPELLLKCEKILFVKANLIKRLIRAKKRDKMPVKQILSRFMSQKNLFKNYKQFADRHGIPIEIIKN
ncbi:dephospho-CoA kinase [uncultured Treponema sp.]|uniref:dephospho-CoA kinase n=1 Tax=uncultured Treponema sp. TaxID=162155 RepID=UPI0025E035B0|nr:dephospho-CoA kinase [uncultured Treponema sp.]